MPERVPSPRLHTVATAGEAKQSWPRQHPILSGVAIVSAVLAASALVNRQLARRAEAANPPTGRFIEVDGACLHYVDRGHGQAVVMLHGNGSMIADFAASGLLSEAASRHRVIAFDRPGFGHSSRPADKDWTPEAQAKAIHAALVKLGVERAVVLGHSWGTLVAVALAQHFPQMVSGLVLESGFYFPTSRVAGMLASAPKVPGLAGIIRHTVAPVAARVMWPMLERKIFAPAPVPEQFGAFPREMAVRPSQLRAAAAETRMMAAAAARLCGDYGRLRMPVAVIVGDGDRLLDPEAQSVRLHHEIAHSTLWKVSGAGHMVHQTNPAEVLAALEEIVAQAA
jgi:pimeloyl-ACP methyl ester carboxylesterase